MFKAKGRKERKDMLKYIVSVSYNKFIFSDGCAALAYAEVSKKTARDDTAVEIELKYVSEDKEGEDR